MNEAEARSMLKAATASGKTLGVAYYRRSYPKLQRAKQLLLGEVVSVRAVATDAHTQRARRTTLSLGLPHRVQDAFAYAFQVTVGAAQVIQIAGQGILDILVLAATALQ